jgi:hypothetical protein
MVSSRAQITIAALLFASGSLWSESHPIQLVKKDGEYYIRRYVPTLKSVGKPGQKYNVVDREAEVINTQGNNVGIELDDVCAYGIYPESNSHIIVCQSGTVFKNVTEMTGSRTGTPPHIAYSNYIGQKTMTTMADSKLAGAGKRTFYCAGPCRMTQGY